MGKPTGFLEYTRQGEPERLPLERIEDFGEFHSRLPETQRREQGARCMNCGVPFCQSGMMLHGMATGCPLHNLIPEWNDEVFRGNTWHALSRLLKTNSFPEFTGRVCPALCEVACLCGVGGKPVTIRDNELSIIEEGFAKGFMKPRPPAVRTGKQVAVVGSGPAGLACADRLNRRGHSVTVFEKSDRPGGLLMYGIPNMKLDKEIVLRRIRLMEDEGVVFRTGVEVGKDVTPQELQEQFDAVVLCCGAEQPRDLAAQGREGAGGVYFAVDFLSRTTKSYLDSRLADGKAVSAKDKDVIVVGGGDTGNDCVGTVIREGCRSVVQLELMPQPPEERAADNPWPEYPRVKKTDYGQQEAAAVFGGDPRRYSTTVNRVFTGEDGEITAVETVKMAYDETGKYAPVPGSEETLPCQLLLIAAGFTGCRTQLPQSMGLELSPRNTVTTQKDSYATGTPGVFAAGDMHRGQSLVVWAIAEGRDCARDVDEFLEGYSNL